MASTQNWKALLAKHGADKPLQNVIDGLLRVCSKIATALRQTEVTALGQHNAFGDEQLSVDVLAEQLLRNYAEKTRSIRAVSSEEDTPLKECNEEGEFILCWDPLDGSSIVDCNWTVGTIVGVWRLNSHNLLWKGKETLIHQTGRQQVAALAVVYGPRTTAVVALNPPQQQQQSTNAATQRVEEKGDKEKEEAEGGKGRKFIMNLRLTDEDVVMLGEPRIRPEAKIFAPANLRATQDLPGYQQLMKYWMEKKFTLRYTGGFVPDVYQIFVKQQGVFCNPASKAAPAKLRMCFEVLPLALLVEAAGGKTSDGRTSLLSVVGMLAATVNGKVQDDEPIEHMDHRTPFCCGSANEVQRFEDALAKATAAT